MTKVESTKKMKKPKKVKHEYTGRFQTTLFGCTDNCGVCWCGLILPCCVEGKTRALLEGRRCDTCDMLCCSPFLNRQLIRTRADIKPHRIYDALECVICFPCFVCQNAREARVILEDEAEAEAGAPAKQEMAAAKA